MSITTPSTARSYYRTIVTAALALASVSGFAMLPFGCSKPSNTDDGPTKLTVAYLGLTCEAPIFVAQEKGFFEEEGLKVELENTDWNGLREGLGTGKFDANHTLIMYVLTAIEKDVDIRITGGIHTGCLRVQVAKDSPIKSVAELKGKKIGVPSHLMSPPAMFCSRVLAANDIDPRQKKKEVVWESFEPDLLGKALQDGRIDALATSDPIGTILLGKGMVKTIADQAVDAPYCDEYCCASVVSGKLARNNPEAAAKVTRALLKAARWVNENPSKAAELGVEKKYVKSTKEINEQALSHLKYLPGVAQCKKSVLDAATEMKKAGLLKDDTDPEELADKAWLTLDGVNDDWVKGLKVEKVANGRPTRLMQPSEFAALFDGRRMCCGCCCLND
jgi:NitT/TauT family transport system substrate-binding protein